MIAIEQKFSCKFDPAQRDYFGAHTYKRIDKDGVYHTEWIN